ncbi:hypothetical protein [Pantoea sp.]|uniref:hypothetical protein n=1 Tax=Pantoea sp. TaxID=69393 RepID=UPI0028AEB2A2|nr:hypothetical protein [Pantoea sp.]
MPEHVPQSNTLACGKGEAVTDQAHPYIPDAQQRGSLSETIGDRQWQTDSRPDR